MRKKPESGSQVVGKLMDGSACEVQETLDGWYHVNSGGIDGYVSSEYVITGDAAKERPCPWSQTGRWSPPTI